jgi:hypothetical protein
MIGRFVSDRDEGCAVIFAASFAGRRLAAVIVFRLTKCEYHVETKRSLSSADYFVHRVHNPFALSLRLISPHPTNDLNGSVSRLCTQHPHSGD